MSVHESAKVAPSKMANKQDTELPKLSTVSEVVAESFDGALGAISVSRSSNSLVNPYLGDRYRGRLLARPDRIRFQLHHEFRECA